MIVSMIIPAYNAERFILRALQSLVDQNVENSEIIVVDNNSTDATVLMINEFMSSCSCPVKVISEKIQGEAAARNAGLAAATGKFIQYLDADDYLLPGKVDQHIRMAEKEELDFVIGGSIQKYTTGERWQRIPDTDPWKGLASGMFGDSNSNFYLKEVLTDIGGFDERIAIGTDIDLYFRLLAATDKVFVDTEPRSVYVHHDGERASDSNMISEYTRRVLNCYRIIKYLQKEEAEYYLENRSYFNAFAIKNLRFLATYDLEESLRLSRELYPNGIKKDDVARDVLPLFSLLYPYFGFEFIERLRLSVKEFLP